MYVYSEWACRFFPLQPDNPVTVLVYTVKKKKKTSVHVLTPRNQTRGRKKKPNTHELTHPDVRDSAVALATLALPQGLGSL